MRGKAFHGVNTPDGLAYEQSWERALRDGKDGVHIRLERGPWNSTGELVGDAIFYANPQFHMEALEHVTREWAAFAMGGFGIGIAHSQGTVYLQQAERLLRTGLPIIFLGSPLSNPALMLAIRAVGFGRAIEGPRRPISFWNVDDPIVGGKMKFPLQGVDEREVSIDGDAWGTRVSEHAAEAYLSTREVRNAIKALWDSE